MAYQSKYTGLQIDDILDSVEWKEGKIEDLEQIRAGAQKGATALQSYTEKYTGTVTGIKINGETKSGSGVIDLGTISTDISGKVDKVAGKQLSTEDFTTALKTKLEGLNNYDDTELSNAVETLRGDFDEIVSGDTTTAIKTFNEVIAFLDGLTDTQDLESIIASIEQQIAGKMDKVTLATVATSGSYNDLTNKPTIPSAVTESTVSGWGFTKNTGTYSKPSGGIPSSDLDTATQNILQAADENNDLIQDFNADIAQLHDNKQDKLVSGTNIKTINGESIVGSGDITISGGGSSSGSGAYPEIDGSIYKEEDMLGNWYNVYELMPNTFYVFPECDSLGIYAFGPETVGVANEYLFQFTSGNEATTLSLPGDLKWTGELTIEPNMIYQVSILKGLASVLEFSNAVVTLIDFTIGGASYQAEEGMHWNQWCMSQYNTDGFYVEENCIWKESRYYIRYKYNHAAVYSDELITAGLDYELKDDMD